MSTSELGKHIISFGLWGDKERYIKGAEANVVLARQFYPGWECWFWVDETVPLDAVQLLNYQSDCRIIFRDSRHTSIDKLLWRFFSIDEPDVEVMIVRDSDSRINEREANAVVQWLASDNQFHVLRDHPSHDTEILGGMWGARKNPNRNYRALADKFYESKNVKLGTGIDQAFLRVMIWPHAKNSCFIHDSRNDKYPFPCSDSKSEVGYFIGRQFFPHDNDWNQFTPPLSEKSIDPSSNKSFNDQMRQEGLLIVLFNDFYGKLDEFTEINAPGVKISTNRNMIPMADAVIVHAPGFINDQEILPRKAMEQLWVCWSMESDVNYPRINDVCFDIKMTYQRQSDIWIPYFSDETSNRINSNQYNFSDKKEGCIIASFISSLVNHSKRLNYLRELNKYIDIHHYGTVLKNRDLTVDNGQDTKLEVYKTYKFAIAFENSISEDYVTEKFFDPLTVGTVPIYLGAPNIEDYSPGRNSYINVRDFPDPQDLADLINRAAADDSIYQQFFDWKSDYKHSNLTQLIKFEHSSEDCFVRLPEVVKNKIGSRDKIRYKQNSGWVLVKLDQAIFLLNVGECIQIKLSETAAAIWQHCASFQTIREIVLSLSVNYPGSENDIQKDVRETIRQFFYLEAVQRLWED